MSNVAKSISVWIIDNESSLDWRLAMRSYAEETFVIVELFHDLCIFTKNKVTVGNMMHNIGMAKIMLWGVPASQPKINTQCG